MASIWGIEFGPPPQEEGVPDAVQAEGQGALQNALDAVTPDTMFPWDMKFDTPTQRKIMPDAIPTKEQEDTAYPWDMKYTPPSNIIETQWDTAHPWDMKFDTPVTTSPQEPTQPPSSNALSLYEQGRQDAIEGKREADFTTHLEMGWEGTMQSLGAGMESMGALAQDIAGEPYEVTKWLQAEGRDIRQAATHRLQKFSFVPIHTDEIVAGIKEGNAEPLYEFIKQSIAGTLPSTSASVATALTGAAIGSTLGPLGTLAGGAIGAFLPSFILNTGETANLIHEISPRMSDPAMAAKAGAISGVLDMIVVGRAVKPLVGLLGKEAIKKQLSSGFTKKTVKGAMAVAVAEAPTEGAQTWVQINAALEATGTKISSERMYDAVKEAMAAGFVGGAVTGGLTHGTASILAPNVTVAKAVAEMERIDNLPIQRNMPPRGTPIDPHTDTINKVSNEFNIPQQFNIPQVLTNKHARKVFGGVAGKSVSSLDIHAPASSAIATFSSMLEAPLMSTVPIGPTYSEEQHFSYGKFHTRLQGILNDFVEGKNLKNISEEENAAVLNALLDTKSNIKVVTEEVPRPPTKKELKEDPSLKQSKTRKPRLVSKVAIPEKLIYYTAGREHSPDAVRAGLELRKLLDEFHIYTHNSGLDVPYIQGYFPVIFNTTTKNEAWAQSVRGKMHLGRGPTPRQVRGLGNADVKERFIGMLTGAIAAPTGKTYKLSTEQAEGVYDTIVGGRGFIEENPLMPLQQDEEGNDIPTELALDTVDFTKQEETAAKEFAKSLNLNLTREDIKAVKKVKKNLYMDAGIGPVRARNLETARQLSKIVDPKDLVEFTDNNIYDVMNNYLIQGTKRVEYAKRFGRKDEKLALLAYKAQADFAKARQNPTLKKYVPNKGAEENEVIKRMFNIADAIQGRYGGNEAFMGMTKTQDWLLTLGYMRTLQLSTLSSLSEPFIMFSRGSPKYALPALGKALSSSMVDFARILFKGIPKTELREFAETMGRVTDYATSEVLTETMEIKGSRAKRWTTTFFRLILLDQFTKFNRIAGLDMGRRMIAGDLKKLAANPNARNARARLTDLGIDIEQGRNWLMQTGGNRNVGHEFLASINFGASRFVDQVVMNPRPTNRPLWMSDPRYHLFAQLKGFQTVFGNTIMQRWIKEINGRGITGNARKIVKYDDSGNHTIVNVDNEAMPFINARTGMIVVSASLMLMAATLGDLLKNVAKYGEPIPDTPWHNGVWRADNEDLMWHLLQRTGMLGAMQFGYDAVRAPEFGGSAIIAAMGPTVSWLEDLLVDVVHPLALSDKEYKDILKSQSFRDAVVRQAIPLQVARPLKDKYQKWLFETVLGSK